MPGEEERFGVKKYTARVRNRFPTATCRRPSKNRTRNLQSWNLTISRLSQPRFRAFVSRPSVTPNFSRPQPPRDQKGSSRVIHACSRCPRPYDARGRGARGLRRPPPRRRPRERSDRDTRSKRKSDRRNDRREGASPHDDRDRDPHGLRPRVARERRETSRARGKRRARALEHARAEPNGADLNHSERPAVPSETSAASRDARRAARR